MRILQRILITFSLLICLCMPMITIQVNATNLPKVSVSNGKVTLEDGKVSDSTSAKSTVISKYKGLATFFGGLATITMVLIFIKHFIELGFKSNNPMERRQITSGLIWSGLAAACLGSITFVMSVMFGLFK